MKKSKKRWFSRVLSSVLALSLVFGGFSLMGLEVTAIAADQTISLNTAYSVNIASSYELKYFKFVPSVTGIYRLISFANSGDPVVHMYNSAAEELAFADDIDSTQNLNFCLDYHLLSGHTYFFGVGCYGSAAAQYNICLSKANASTGVTFPSMDLGTRTDISISLPFEAACYRITPAETKEYLFFSSDSTGDPQIWLYNSSFSQIDGDDDDDDNDDAEGLDFRMVTTLTAHNTYYLVLRYSRTNTGAFTLNSYMSADIDDVVCCIKNCASEYYMDIHGPVEQEWVHQWEFHSDTQLQWRIQKQADGYYTIRSEYGNKKYVGVSTVDTNVDNIKLYSAVSDATKWRIYKLSSGQLIIVPKLAVAKVLYSPGWYAGTELQLAAMSSAVSSRTRWTQWVIATYFAQVYNYFDDGYSVYHREHFETSRELVDGYMAAVAERYLELLGLSIMYNSANYHWSPIDVCKGTVTLNNIDDLCSHSGTIHTERENVITDCQDSFPGSDTITSVLWSCHCITNTATNGDLEQNRSCSSGNVILMLDRNFLSNRSLVSKATLMHELNHQFGAQDHYHELADKADVNSCKFKDICSECGTNPRPESCIMGDPTQNISNEYIICDACLEDIRSHLEDHHLY